MKKTNEKLLIKGLLMIFLIAFTTKAFSQETLKYDYAEIIVLQKVAKNKSEIKQVYLNSTTNNSLEKSKINQIKNTTSLFELMNNNNWEYVERLGSQPSNSGPIWINYIFRKKK